MMCMRVAPHGDRILQIGQIDDQGEVRSNEIKVRLMACSINPHDSVVLRDPARYLGRIPLADGAGIVEAVGHEVTEFAVGDRVVSTFFPNWLDGPPTVEDFSGVPGDGINGFARESVVAPWSAFTKAPVDWTHIEAATIPTAGLTAWNALTTHGDVKSGHHVAVIGTGGVSIYVLQIAKALGAVVTVVSSSERKLALARGLGADHSINYKDTPKWGKEISAQGGADLVVDTVGWSTLEQSMFAVKRGGYIVTIGIQSTDPAPLNLPTLLLKQIRLTGMLVGSRRQQLEFVEALGRLKIHPNVDKVFPLTDLENAFAYYGSGKHFGKIGIAIA